MSPRCVHVAGVYSSIFKASEFYLPRKRSCHLSEIRSVRPFASIVAVILGQRERSVCGGLEQASYHTLNYRLGTKTYSRLCFLSSVHEFLRIFCYGDELSKKYAAHSAGSYILSYYCHCLALFQRIQSFRWFAKAVMIGHFTILFG